jgi:hypothetical protein
MRWWLVFIRVASSVAAAHIYGEDPPRVTVYYNWLGLSLSKYIRHGLITKINGKRRWDFRPDLKFNFKENFCIQLDSLQMLPSKIPKLEYKYRGQVLKCEQLLVLQLSRFKFKFELKIQEQKIVLNFTNLIQRLRGFEKYWNLVQNFMITHSSFKIIFRVYCYVKIWSFLESSHLNLIFISNLVTWLVSVL